MVILVAICSSHLEQFVPVTASVNNNNNSLKTQTVKKQKLPIYQREQPPTYQIDSFKKESNKKRFSKVDASLDKTLFCLCIKLSSSHFLRLDGEETRVLLSHFVHQLRCKNVDLPDIYFTSLDAVGLSPSLVLNQNAKTKEIGSWVLFKM